MSGVEKKLDLEVDRLRLIDVSSEDDCLLASPSGFSENHYGDDCFDLFEVDDAQDTTELVDQGEVEPMSSESLERGSKNGKCNLRKSLAWDSAFFTNEGVLDQEELSSINNGVTKADRRPLPGIQEDVRTSAESNFTVNSDNVSLESLEVGLFEDVRASIQRSNKASNVVRTSSNAISGVSVMKKAELASRNKVKPILGSKRQSISTQATDKAPKEAVTAVRARVMQPSATSGVLNTSSLRPPKIVGRTNPISGTPTKKSSLGHSRVKIENNTAKPASVSGHGSPIGRVLKKSASGSSSVNPRTTALTKSPLGSSPSSTKTKTTTSGSPLNSSASNSSDSTSKSPSKILRNKTVSRNATSSSTSTLKVPVRNSLRSKTEPENSRLTAYLKSMPNPSASISPASSIDGWSSESSSSTSTVHQWPNSSRASIAISSPRRGISLERDSRAPQTSDLKNRQHDVPSAKRSSVGTGSLSHQASANTSKSFKPSGLRLPSPKMGYFDAEKSLSHSPNGSSQLQSGARSGTLKTGLGTGNPNEEAAKTKLSKFQPARILAGNGNMKVVPHGGRVVRSASSPRPSTEPPTASPKSSRAVKAKSPDLESKVQTDSFPETRRENHLKSGVIGELPNVSDGNAESVKNAMEIDIQCISKTSISNDCVIKVICCEEDEPPLPKGISDSQGEYIGSNTIACEKAVQDSGLHENNPQFKTKVGEKENLIRSNDLVDASSNQMAVMDLKALDLVKDPIEKVVYHLSDSNVNNLDIPGDTKLISQDRTLIVPSKEDFQKIASKLNMLSLSPNSMDSRTPLASNVHLLRNMSGSLELGSEPAMETIPSALPLQESTEKENT